MGDEPESDADSPEQPTNRDESPDLSTPSNDTSASSTDDSTEMVDGDSSGSDVDRDGDVGDVDPDDVADDVGSGDNGSAIDFNESTTDTDESESPLQPEAEGDVSLIDDEANLEPVTHRGEDGTDSPEAPGDQRRQYYDSAGPSDDFNDDFGDDFSDDFGDDFSDDFADVNSASNPVPEPYEEPIENVETDSSEGFADDFDDEFADDFDDDDDFGGFADGPETDNEMPLADHIEEMVRRLAVVLLIGGAVALSVFGLGEALEYVPSTIDIINFLWNRHIPGAGQPGNETLRPHIYGPLELIFTKLKVASLAGVVVGLPVFVYETYLFMRPGLYRNERKYYLASVPTSLILAVVGVAFAHFVVLPSIFAYFTSYTEGTALIAFGLSETFNLILILMGYMAIVFQIPLFIMLAIMMNLVTRQWLENKRLIFWGSFLGLAFLVSPDPTGMAPIIIAITMVVLFEGTLALLRWTGN